MDKSTQTHSIQQQNVGICGGRSNSLIL